jgi:hypothetical protein
MAGKEETVSGTPPDVSDVDISNKQFVGGTFRGKDEQC